MLRLGDTSILIAPQHGGAILGWMDGGVPVLRRPSPEAVTLGDSHAMACFPMLPYCNRVANAKFEWNGRTYVLNRNFGDHPHAIHGIGWQRSWTVEKVSTTEIILCLGYHPKVQGQDRDWPFAFDARLTYGRLNNGIAITLQVVNRHDAAAPLGIGLHPWFPTAGTPRLRFSAQGVWTNDATHLPRDHSDVPAAWSHETLRPVSCVGLDNCFTGWDGRAEINAGPVSLQIQADPVFGNLQVFTPPGAGFFCVEPVSHIPDAINRPGLGHGQGMAAVPPQGSLSGSITLSRV